MRATKTRISLFILPFAFALSGCLVDKGELVDDIPPGYCDSLQATYVDTLKTLIDLHCATSVGCHGALSGNGDFTTYTNMQAFGVLDENGVGARVTTTNLNMVMPQGNPLPDSVQQIFQCWANAQYPQQ